MKWLSGRCATVCGFVTLSAVFAGVLSMVPATGHAAGRTDGARREAAMAVARSRVAAPRDASVTTWSAGCDEALDALSLCQPPTATAKRSSGDAAAPDRRAPDAWPALVTVQPAPKAVVDAAAAVEAPARLLPVFALGLAILAALLALFGVRACSSRAGREAPAGRSFGRPAPGHPLQIGFPRKSATASIAKQRLLHYRTAPQ